MPVRIIDHTALNDRAILGLVVGEDSTRSRYGGEATSVANDERRRRAVPLPVTLSAAIAKRTRGPSLRLVPAASARLRS